MRFSHPVSCHPFWRKTALHEDDARRKLGRTPCWECKSLAWISCCIARIACNFAAGAAQDLCEPLLSRIASESESVGCCEHLMTFEYILLTNLAVSDKLNINFAAWCCYCMSCISCKCCKYLKCSLVTSHIFISSKKSSLSLSGWIMVGILHGCLLSDGIMGWITQVWADDTLCCSPRATDNGILGFSEVTKRHYNSGDVVECSVSWEHWQKACWASQ